MTFLSSNCCQSSTKQLDHGTHCEQLKTMENLCFVFYFFFLTHQIFPISANTLIPPESLKDGENLTSQSEVFELGFFSPPNSRNRYLGIWFKKIPLQTVVWVANRDTPLIDSSGIFMISSTGNLVILNETNQTIWSTNLSKVAEKPIMEFLESGNLVLRDNTSDECLWQSFDHPSDTMLPDMKIGWDLSIGLNRYLTSWKSTDDPSLGDYTCGIDLTPYPEPVVRNGANKTYRSGPWNGLRNSGQPELTNSITFIYQVVGNEIEASYFSFKHNQQPDVQSRVILRQNGNHGELQRLTWVVNRSQNWLLQYPIPRDRCDEYGRCGVGSTCDINEVPGCNCLEGFKPASPADWSDMDWSRGCVRKIPLDCAKGDGFLKLTEVKVPDTTRTWMNMSISLDECRVKCLKNCSCMAYANTNIRGNGSGCVMWFGDLIDIRNLLGAGQDLYIRVAASELGDAPSKAKAGPKSKKRTKTMVVMISVIASTVLLALGIYVLWRKKITESITRESSDERDHLGQVQDPPFDQVFIHGKKEFSVEKNDDLELNMFDMDAIEKATNNFSNKNMLGQGGFGCVYKGTLGDGQQMAVKRLSKNSGQGVDEFKNEVILIAKLQHRNLVRLLGYCVEWEEKILVYEYMENKGLDEILFDKANKITLDWPKRFSIIVGISRGLLYLHQDSRFRIIHRDLKPSNVLLDGELTPKISDFGMARIFGGDDSEAKTKRVVGTYGYMSPEYAMDGLFSVKSDVFSFGVLVLEIISGRKNKGFFLSSDSEHNLLGYAWTLWKEGHVLDLIDETVKDSCLENEAVRCIHIGLLCVQEHAEDRPTMSSVVLMLSTDTALQQPKQPGFCFGKSRIGTGSTSNNRESHSINVVTVTKLEAR